MRKLFAVLFVAIFAFIALPAGAITMTQTDQVVTAVVPMPSVPISGSVTGLSQLAATQDIFLSHTTIGQTGIYATGNQPQEVLMLAATDKPKAKTKAGAKKPATLGGDAKAKKAKSKKA